MAKRNMTPKRESYIEKMQPDYLCEKTDLTNESSVEKFFVDRLIQKLGYKDRHIKSKTNIKPAYINLGSKKEKYSPDYILHNQKKTPVLVIDAKSTTENVYDYIGQVTSYSVLLYKKHKLIHYIISNGHKTLLMRIDKENPVMVLDFKDVHDGNKKFEKLKEIISLSAKNSPTAKESGTEDDLITLKSISKETAQKLFKACHKKIWSAEKRSPTSAFMEFVKLIFVKLYNDKMLHASETCLKDEDGITVPRKLNRFSEWYIVERESEETPNPIDEIFQGIHKQIKADVLKNKKKSMFSEDEKINLKANTIKEVAKKLQYVDLIRIDEDLNGRLFETFLNATMRGEALGQYFTPRSIVLLASKMADLQAGKNHSDKVIDASCGTGGYLIEAFTLMRQRIRDNGSYSNTEKENLINDIANNCMFGIDAATDVALSRIARMNMYLHGDGGSHIYYGDGLDKNPEIKPSDSPQQEKDIEDMRESIKDGMFDVVLTNPPFSMWYEDSDEEEKRILNQYELAEKDDGKRRKRLRGSALFIERYYDLLKEGGKLITVIDDSVLESDDFSYLRDYIRKNFIVRAIISLHGDAFQMAKARAKTSLLYLRKKTGDTENQTDVFMYQSIRLGVDDLPVTSSPAKIIEARKKANDEIDAILGEFKKFEAGQRTNYKYKPSVIQDRLDVKYCTVGENPHTKQWMRKGHQVKRLGEILTLRDEIVNPKEEFPGETFHLLKISYNGMCGLQESRLGRNINYRQCIPVKEGDVVFSEYNTIHGAIGYIDKFHEGYLASGSYIVTCAKRKMDALYIWNILRTTELKISALVTSVGMGRKTISWDSVKDIEIPWAETKKRDDMAKKTLQAWEAQKRAADISNDLEAIKSSVFGLNTVENEKILEGMKPPK